MQQNHNPILIERTPEHLWPEALELVFADLEDATRQEQVELALTEAGRNPASLDGLFYADGGGRVVGAVLAEPRVGKTANVWLPRLADGASAQVGLALMDAMCQWLDAQGIALAQTLPAAVSEEDSKALDFAHFTHIADLFYLVAISRQFPSSPPASQLRFVSISQADSRALARVVEGTYEATQDCEAIEGVRQIDDVLAGYRAIGQSDTREWYLVRYSDEVIGCLLLADHPPHGNLELVYMGVLPSWRGRGWGIEIAQWAQWRAGVLGRERLVLAVDTHNSPAMAAYVAAGFHAWDRRNVYIRTQKP